MDDVYLVMELTDTFRKQIVRYRELKELVQKMLGKLVLSRGDLSGLVGAMERKKQLLDTIEHERHLHDDAIFQWQSRKENFKRSSEVNELNAVLDNVGTAIREFIDEEEQLRNYLQRFVLKSGS